MFAKGNVVALSEQDVCSGTAVFGNSTLHSMQFLLQEPCPCDVVCMTVSVHCNVERKDHQSSQPINIFNFAGNVL